MMRVLVLDIGRDSKGMILMLQSARGALPLDRSARDGLPIRLCVKMSSARGGPSCLDHFMHPFGSFLKLGDPHVDPNTLYSLLWGPPKWYS